MPEDNRRNAAGPPVDAAFAMFRQTAAEHVPVPGVARIEAQLRHRRRVRTTMGVTMAALALGGAAAGFGILVPTPTPSAEPSLPASTGVPTPRPSVSESPTAASPTAEQADLSVSVSYLTFSPPDETGQRQGGLIVLVVNNGPADASGFRVTVRMPDGISAAGPGPQGCALSGSAGRYQCAYGRLAAGDSAHLNFSVVAAGTPRTDTAADRSVQVSLSKGTDPDLANNHSTYIVKLS